MHQTIQRLRAGHLGEVLGTFSPQVEERLLWIVGEDPLELAPSLVGVKPLEGDPTQFALRILELGYTGVVFGGRDAALMNSDPDSDSLPLHRWMRALRAVGLTAWLKPTISSTLEGCVAESSWRQGVTDALESLLEGDTRPDGIVWRVQAVRPSALAHRSAQNDTQLDLVAKELQLVQKTAGDLPLSFFIVAPSPSIAERQAEWLERLAQVAERNTTIAFSCVAGYFQDDHRPQHPVWSHARTLHGLGTGALTPLINAGAVQQGEGLWPSIPLELFHQAHSILGLYGVRRAIVTSSTLPSGDGVLAVSLSTASGVLFSGHSPTAVSEQWLAAHCPSSNTQTVGELLRQGGSLVRELSLIRSLPPGDPDGFRAKVDLFFAKIQAFRSSIEQGTHDWNALTEHAIGFCRDARRICCHVGQRFNVSLNSELTPDDLKGGFWTEAAGHGGAVRLLDKPVASEVGFEDLLAVNRAEGSALGLSV